MFTGLVEEVGRVELVRRHGTALRLRIGARVTLDGTRVGDSIAVSGACLTVTGLESHAFEVEMVAETAGRTTLGTAASGTEVNLERSLCIGDRLGGHWVLGHVDGIAAVRRLVDAGPGERRMTLTAPAGLGALLAEKGSVALDGVSLTVAAVDGDSFTVALIPHTWERTTLRSRRVGDPLNVEVDVLARYAARLWGARAETPTGLTEEWMRGQGYR
jgi:riboflavin synthase